MGMIRETIVDVEQYDVGYPEFSKLLEFRDWLDSILEKVPEQYRSEVELDLDTTSGYEDSAYVRITISYLRPETEQEAAESAEREDLRKAQALQMKMAQFEMLKRELGA